MYLKPKQSTNFVVELTSPEAYESPIETTSKSFTTTVLVTL
jgi:hypothetical protein